MSAKKKNFLKKYRGTIILVGLVLVLAASYVWLLPLIQAGQEQNGDETNPEVVRLIDVDQYSIQHILINNKEQVIELEYVPTKGYNSDGTEYETYIWNLVQPEGYNDLDQLLIRGIPTHFSSLESTKIIEREPENLSKYGLDNPSTITVTLTNGEKMTVKVGDKAPLVAARYVQVGDDPTVYTVKSYNAGKIVPFINELRTTAIFDFPATEVVALSMGRDGDKLFSARRSEDDIWLLDYPIPADTNSDTINTLIESLISLFRHTFRRESQGFRSIIWMSLITNSSSKRLKA